jgi:hypothetical protein
MEQQIITLLIICFNSMHCFRIIVGEDVDLHCSYLCEYHLSWYAGFFGQTLQDFRLPALAHGFLSVILMRFLARMRKEERDCPEDFLSRFSTLD